jgi:outer membrane protein assembly factor BamB
MKTWSLKRPRQVWLVALAGALLLIGVRASADEAIAQTKFHSNPAPLAPGAVTTDWPCLLGPDHNETSRETHVLGAFPAGGPKLVWEIGKGEGYAAPAIQDDRLVLFHRIKEEEVIECLSPQTGNRSWRFTYPTNYQDEYGYCNGPRSSPIIGDDAVFAIGAEGKLHCLELANGKLRWQHDIVAEYKLAQNFFGIGSTPLVEHDKLIVNVGAEGGPCVVAFDVKSGAVAWKAGNQWGPSYASPIPATIRGKRRVLVFAGGRSNPPTGGLLCIDPQDGKTDFEFPWRGTVRESVNAMSPLVLGDQVLISETYGSGGTLLDITPDMQPKPLWTSLTFGIHFMTPIEKAGYLYGVDGHGPNDAFLVCADRKTGKEIWRTQPEWKETLTAGDGQEPRELAMGTYRSWLLPVDGKYLCLGEYGHLLWIDLSPKSYRELGRATLFTAAETWTPPVLSRGLLYINQNAADPVHHTTPRLLCYDLRGP